jgi:hypothetical protein
MSQTDKLIAELSELFADNSYSKEFIKERLDNLALVAALEEQIKMTDREIVRLKRINATYSLGAIGLSEPEDLKDDKENFDYQL